MGHRPPAPELPADLQARALLGSDVRSLCAAAAAARAWAAALGGLGAGAAEVWRCALTAPQTPDDEPGTYTSGASEGGAGTACRQIVGHGSFRSSRIERISASSR
ncbi:unnamed protein product, partial [Prorocentrum cordatum]